MSDNLLEEKRLGDWNIVAELEGFVIVRTAPKGLLGTPMADVLFTYKRKSNQKIDRKSAFIYMEKKELFIKDL